MGELPACYYPKLRPKIFKGLAPVSPTKHAAAGHNLISFFVVV